MPDRRQWDRLQAYLGLRTTPVSGSFGLARLVAARTLAGLVALLLAAAVDASSGGWRTVSWWTSGAVAVGVLVVGVVESRKQRRARRSPPATGPP